MTISPADEAISFALRLPRLFSPPSFALQLTLIFSSSFRLRHSSADIDYFLFVPRHYAFVHIDIHFLYCFSSILLADYFPVSFLSVFRLKAFRGAFAQAFSLSSSGCHAFFREALARQIFFGFFQEGLIGAISFIFAAFASSPVHPSIPSQIAA
jgi:hypothetical protein